MHLIDKHIRSNVSIAPLAAFRILFGFIMCVSIIRFIAKGWITQLYVTPQFYFPFINAQWCTPLDSFGMHFLFVLMALSSLGILLGFHYRIATFIFFLAFTYVELLDKSNYLNHYYFVSIISFLFLFVPANRYFSLDVLRNKDKLLNKIPAYNINIFKLQLAIVYFYAGVAKLNSDWLFHALPLKIWLPARADMPIIGELLTQEWMAYVFSWTGAIYDLCIPFLLLYKRTRNAAFIAVIIFHILTGILFPIGMFPYIMILSTLIFFSAEWHERNFKWLQKTFQTNRPLFFSQKKPWSAAYPKLTGILLVIFFIIQLLLPWRYLFYSGNLFWTEQGYRFSWRVMLMEKAGHATFYVRNPETNNEAQINNSTYLQPYQEKQMSFQPDMMLQFAHFLEEEYQQKGIQDPEVRVEAYVTLNGRKSKLMIDPYRDLTKENINLKPKDWIIPYAARY